MSYENRSVYELELKNYHINMKGAITDIRIYEIPGDMISGDY